MRVLFEKRGYDVRLVDGVYASKRCSVCCCGGETKTLMQCTDTQRWRERKERMMWHLLQCQNMECEWIHNRNRNATLNLLRVALAILHSLRYPASLCCPRGGDSKKHSASSSRSSRKRRSIPSAAGRSDRAMGAAASRQCWTRSDTLPLSPSGTAEPERRFVPREGNPRGQA